MSADNTKTHTDIKLNGWIDRILPAAARPYAYLMRLDRPIGTWLLLLPGWWAVMLAGGGALGADWGLMALFGMGAVIMRGAGCVINDMWDRDLDRMVERTRGRPLAAGTVSRKQAAQFTAILFAAGFLILLQMSTMAIVLGILTLPLIVTYPLMKRVTWWPQAFLGITFNFGALIGWAAVTGSVPPAALVLYAAGILWTLGYDTVYAHQDKDDDALVGIRSTALKFGAHGKIWVAGFYAAACVMLLAAFVLAGAGWLSCLLLALPAAHAVWQWRIWRMDDPRSSLAVFKAARDFGLLVLLAAML
ncbi:MAG: 4-hydroxybenzoate octaprenyltransferase [Alphaproteobacteria bacterium]|nr:4-hydroxybenzoate octaprenyltransferase [Alphaproteobacteria bacterium]